MEKQLQKNLANNIEFSEEWLVEQIIKTDFEQKQTGQIKYAKIKKIELLQLVLKFVRLNKRGE